MRLDRDAIKAIHDRSSHVRVTATFYDKQMRGEDPYKGKDMNRKKSIDEYTDEGDGDERLVTHEDNDS